MVEQINLQYISMSGQSRKIQAGKTIRRPQDYDHLNTTFIPYDRTINTVSYYQRRKRELKRHPTNEVVINLTQRNAERKDLKNQFENLIRSNKNIDPYLSNYIREVSVEPVLNDNKFTNFNKELYPLSEDQKVKVVEEKYFPLQNYYNYIYDMQTKKQIFRFATETQAKIKEAIHEQNLQHSNYKQPHEEPYGGDKSQFKPEDERMDKKIKGLHTSKFDPRSAVFKRQSLVPADQLAPVHTNYLEMPDVQNNYVFTVNQKSRLQLSKRI